MRQLIKIMYFIFLTIGFNLFAQTSTVTDFDGTIYQTVKIGNQWWMVENLKVTHYRNGDTIPYITESSQWINLSTGAYCAYNNNEANVETYGYLYNWFAVNDGRNIAPVGWHVPTNAEWDILMNYLGGYEVAGGKMKTTGATYWNLPNEGATNESGFNGLPGGMRFNEDGGFYNLRDVGLWWTSTKAEANEPNAYNKYLQYHNDNLSTNTYKMRNGYSIRCVKDEESNINNYLELNSLRKFSLYQNYPNPFNPQTTIKYYLHKPNDVTLKIYNIAGQEIEILINGFNEPGEHEIIWQTKGLPSGIYFYRLKAGDFSETKKLIFQK